VDAVSFIRRTIQVAVGLAEPTDALLPPQPHNRHSLDQDYTVAARAVLGGLHHEYWWERVAA
jgi:hypothetical protein